METTQHTLKHTAPRLTHSAKGNSGDNASAIADIT